MCYLHTLQIEITSLQTRYGTLKGANATVEAQITAMSNAIKLIGGDEKIADMRISVESIEVSALAINYSTCCDNLF